MHIVTPKNYVNYYINLQLKHYCEGDTLIIIVLDDVIYNNNNRSLFV